MTSFPTHHCTLGALLERLAAELPEQEALVFPGRDLRLSWSGLEQRSLALARGLIGLGVQPGDRVALWSDNRPDWIPFQFAVARSGAVLVTLNTALTAPEAAFVLRQSRASIVVTAPGVRGEEFSEALGAMRAAEGHWNHGGEALAELRYWILLEGRSQPGALSVDELVARGGELDAGEVRGRTAAASVEDPLCIQYTSGTTGFPKGAVLSHQNLVENAYTLMRTIDARDDDRLLVQVPLFHTFGCSVSVVGAATHGIPMVVLQGFEPGAALAAIDGERCTIAHGVPLMFRAMLGHPDFEQYDLSCLKKGIMAGAMCPEPLMREVIAKTGAKGMVVAYGLTEASPCITSSSPGDPVEVRCATVGRALAGVEVRVVDPASGEDVAVGEEGELWARGPNIMQGYFENPEATAEALVDGGWLRTGDLVRADAQGLYRITGRAKEMIIRGGENVYPAEVEDALRAHPAVADAAVFGLPDEKYGESVAAALVPVEGAELDDDELAGFLEERLAFYKRPTRLFRVSGFPVTASGKVQRFRLAEHCGA